MIRTATWDVVAWNRAEAAVFTDYGALPAAERNVLRLIFLDPEARTVNRNWDSVARFVVGMFRGDAARAGGGGGPGRPGGARWSPTPPPGPARSTAPVRT